jgi:hypothetical protein
VTALVYLRGLLLVVLVAVLVVVMGITDEIWSVVWAQEGNYLREKLFISRWLVFL